MTRAYLRLDPRFDERKADYPDGAYRALIATLCLAETQPDRGRFRSIGFLKALLERRGRWAKYLLEHGDVVVLDDGRVYVDGWDEWQEGDVTVRERVQRIRNRRRGNGSRSGRSNGLARPPVTPDVTVGDTPDDTARRSKLVIPRIESGAEQSGAPLSDDERREHLDQLRDILDSNGALPPKAGEKREPAGPPADDDVAVRCRAILDDPESPDWKRQAAKAQLELLDGAA